MRARTTCAGVLVLLLTGCSGGPGPGSTPEGTVAPTTAGDTTPGAADTASATTAAPQRDTSVITQQAAPTGQTGQPRGLDVQPETVDRADVDEVAEVFALTMLTPDTALDASTLDATRRAAQWMTPEYAAQQTAERPASGGATWLALAKNEGYWAAELAPTAATEQGLITTGPEDLNAERPYVATITARDADLPAESFGVVVYLTRLDTDAPWQVYDWYRETPYG